MEDEISLITSLQEKLMWRPYFENIEVEPSLKDASQIIWTCIYVSATSCYESKNIFIVHSPWIEDQFSDTRGA